MRANQLTLLAILLALAGQTRAAEDGKIPEPIDGFKGIAALLPKPMWPDKAKGWTELQAKAATDWARKEFVNQRVKMTGKPGDIRPTKDGGASASLNDRHIKSPAREVIGVCDVFFPKSAVPEVEKVGKGDAVTFVGTIRAIELRAGDNDDGTQTIEIAVSVVGAHVQPPPKK